MNSRMLGRVNQPWCSVCRTPPGPDCAVIHKRAKRAQRHVERQQWMREVWQHLSGDYRRER